MSCWKIVLFGCRHICLETEVPWLHSELGRPQQNSEVTDGCSLLGQLCPSGDSSCWEIWYYAEGGLRCVYVCHTWQPWEGCDWLFSVVVHRVKIVLLTESLLSSNSLYTYLVEGQNEEEAVGIVWYQGQTHTGFASCSECGPWTSNIDITWEIGGNSNSWAFLQTEWIENSGAGAQQSVFKSFPGESDSCLHLKTTALITHPWLHT